MKVLLIHNFYKNPGGEDTHVIQMKNILEKKGHIVVPYFMYSKDIDGYSIWQKTLLALKNVFSLRSYRKIIKLFKEENPDIAQVYNVTPLISPSVYFGLKEMNIPTIQIIQNFRYMCPNGLFLTRSGQTCEKCKNGNFINAIIRKCYRNSYLQTIAQSINLYSHRKLGTFSKKIDIFVTTSEFSRKKFIESGLSPNKIMTINGFIDVDDLEPSWDSNNYAVYMGRLSQEKGIYTLLKAFKEISSLDLKIIGEGPIRKELESYVSKEGKKNIKFLGYIKGQKRFDILRRAKFMILPSECYDTFPFVVLESFALGTPVIGSKIGGIAEQIENGKNGLLFHPKDHFELQKEIKTLIENPDLVHSMRKYARKSAEERYSQEVGYNHFMEVYSQLISKKRNESIKQ
jgi:glycosyltransferase involved in cell wall biosynthesis